MPMYEYACQDCGATFELLRGMHQADDGVHCITCGSPKVQRMLSLFAAVSREGSSFSASEMGASEMGASGGCCGGSCGGGTCSPL